MKSLALIALLPLQAMADAPLQPPGAPELGLELYDIRIEPELVRFRFSHDGGDRSFDTLEPALHWLCETVAARVLMTAHLPQTKVVVSISDQKLPFGESAPDAEQFFEAFSVDRFECTWEYY